MANYRFMNNTSNKMLLVDGYLFRPGQWTIAQSIRLINMCKALSLPYTVN